jgi:hypothetical protein
MGGEQLFNGAPQQEAETLRAEAVRRFRARSLALPSRACMR